MRWKIALPGNTKSCSCNWRGTCNIFLICQHHHHCLTSVSSTSPLLFMINIFIHHYYPYLQYHYLPALAVITAWDNHKRYSQVHARWKPKIKLEFRSWFLWREKNRSTRRKTLEAQERTNKQLYSHKTPSSAGLKPESHWWEGSALTTTPPVLPHINVHITGCGINSTMSVLHVAKSTACSAILTIQPVISAACTIHSASLTYPKELSLPLNMDP